jgi:glutamate--cysteine ligase
MRPLNCHPGYLQSVRFLFLSSAQPVANQTALVPSDDGVMILPAQLTKRLDLLSTTQHLPLLTQIKRGIEKESLRIDAEGKLSKRPHPPTAGSALTHPHITTDFSEALLEFITPASTQIDGTLDCLDKVHRFMYSHLGDEQLWGASMPCVLEGDNNIPLAQYGKSNVAKMKTIYRHGLGNRYGRLMQTIAGIHYNFSVPDALWPVFQQQDSDDRALKDYITDSYFKLIRNFNRSSWLLIYLYGASPAVCKSFLNGRKHQLEEHDNGSLYLPYATALRMGDLGYQSSAQENLQICYNNIDNYISTLSKAITEPHVDYQNIGLNADGHYQQLSTGLLQIENEFYSLIRPKRVAQSGQTPLGALNDEGVEYIEVRCIDVNPYLPLGIDADQIRFMDCFLLYNLLEDSPLCDCDDRHNISENIKQVVNHGRKPGLSLKNTRGQISLNDWGNDLIDGIEKVARLLDQAHNTNEYLRVCRDQRDKLADSQLTPSAKILSDMRSHDIPFFRLAMNHSLQHGEYFRQRPLDSTDQSYFSEQTALSLQQQAEIENSDTLSFEQYLAQYYKQYDELK